VQSFCVLKEGGRYCYHCTLTLNSVHYKCLKHFVITDRLA